MKLAPLFLEQLDRETKSTRRLLERVPEGKGEWKPHAKSMQLGYLANLVATMPGWIAMMIDADFLDLGNYAAGKMATNGRELAALFDKKVADARRALSSETDEHLMKPWQLRVSGKVVDEKPRYQQIADTFTHFAHHRGQLTVYLRLNDVAVPQIYGPTADEGWG
ncbi:MAG TPA: DinB family protein [Thermoanaerobaculia bacterium]|nr:DinB family protein [Thermoanaerobaculia bacterium]